MSNFIYGLKVHGIWNSPYLHVNNKDKKSILYTSDNIYDNLNIKQVKQILKDELDVISYSPTKNNIIREFGFFHKKLTNIDKACIKKIIEYYKFRKSLYNEICKTVLCNNMTSFMKKNNITSISFNYNIPAEYNNFSCDDPNYDGGQVEAYIEVYIRTK